MNKKLSLICLLTVISFHSMHGMFRSIIKSKAIENSMGIAAGGAALGLFGSTVSAIGSNQTLLDGAIDIAVSTAACSVIPAFIAAPIYAGSQAFNESGYDPDRVLRFGHTLEQNTLQGFNMVLMQPENKQAIDDLLQAHWSLHRWKTDYKEVSSLEGGLNLGAAPCAGVPLCAIFMYQHYNLEMFAAGMTLNYLLATAALVQQKSRSNTIQKAIEDCARCDKSMSFEFNEFITKHIAMVEKVRDQFQPTYENYKDHTNWAARQIEEKGEFYSPNIKEQIQSFDKIILEELRSFTE